MMLSHHAQPRNMLRLLRELSRRLMLKLIPRPRNQKCNVSKNGRCGPKYGNTICPAGYCSKWWWCGTSALHKSTHQVAFDAKKACSAKKTVKKVVKKSKGKKTGLKLKVSHKVVVKGKKVLKHKVVVKGKKVLVKGKKVLKHKVVVKGKKIS